MQDLQKRGWTLAFGQQGCPTFQLPRPSCRDMRSLTIHLKSTCPQRWDTIKAQQLLVLLTATFMELESSVEAQITICASILPIHNLSDIVPSKHLSHLEHIAYSFRQQDVERHNCISQPLQGWMVSYNTSFAGWEAGEWEPGGQWEVWLCPSSFWCPPQGEIFS